MSAAHLFGVLRRLDDDLAVILALSLYMLRPDSEPLHRGTDSRILRVVVFHVAFAKTYRAAGHRPEILDAFDDDITLAFLRRQVHNFVNAHVALNVFVFAVLE